MVSDLSALVVSPCMSSTRSEYQELGLEIVELWENTYRRHNLPHIAREEKRDDEA